VILDDNTPERPHIEYPCAWGFKLIGRDREKLEACIADIMADRDHTCEVGNLSKKGNFVTMNARCEVCSEEERNRIFKAFSEHEDVKMVI